jgi:hypothetical protein
MIEYEYFHLDSENRKNGNFLEILHPDFEEFGQSGKNVLNIKFLTLLI